MSRSLFALLNRRFGPRRDDWTRREMLQASLAAAAGLLLSDRFGSAQDPPAGRAGERILVVGAGFGGLAAAYELTSAGYDVTVVEARNRVGGRVLTFADFIKGKTVEGGGELIGSNHLTWAAYKKKFGLEFLEVTEDKDAEAPIVLGGKKLDAKESDQLWEEMKKAVNEMNADAKDVDADEPWTHPKATDLDSRATAAWIESLKVSDRCKKGIDVQLYANNGVLTSWQSYLGNLAQVKGGGLEKYWTDTEAYRCKGGNGQLAQNLAAGLGDKRLFLKTPVSAIKYTDKGATATLADGRKLEADDVVLAVPPSVWNRIAFDPTLPGPLKPQMGVNVKFLVPLARRFWTDSKLSPDSLTDGPVSMTWEATDKQPEAGGVCLTVFSGAAAADQGRDWKANEREGNYLEALAQMYPDIRKHFTAGSSRFMDWPSDPWTRASYSFPAPGQVTTVGPILREGLLGHLHFAGEHACYAFVGYMEGALKSGVDLAKRLAKRDGVVKK